MSLLLIRSYAEHRASTTLNHRTVIIEASPVFALLFLNNNLHYLHHKRPREPWYRLPQIYRQNAERIREENGGFSFNGYRGLFRAHLCRKHDSLIHPHRSGKSG
jgi:fatty acid desaturase